MGNITRAKVTICGTRTLLQHHFGIDAIPLEKEERTGVAGNNPNEWKKTRMVDDDGELYVPGTYIFSCLKNGALHTKRGRGSMQSALVSTLQVEDDVIYLNRKTPDDDQLTMQSVLTPHNPKIETFVYVTSVRNPSTKGRNIRYRLATRMGWKARFTICWDKTVVPRDVMKAILHDAGKLSGLGDGLKIGCGRFDVIGYKELNDAQEKTTEGDLGSHETNGVVKGRKKMREMREEAAVE